MARVGDPRSLAYIIQDKLVCPTVLVMATEEGWWWLVRGCNIITRVLQDVLALHNGRYDMRTACILIVNHYEYTSDHPYFLFLFLLSNPCKY